MPVSRYDPYVEDAVRQVIEAQQPGAMKTIMEQGTRDPGSHVLELLGMLDNPRNALASAAYNAIQDDPNDTAISGFRNGLTGKQDTSWGDVVGIPAGTSEDSWPVWLAKQGARLGLDVTLDPLMGLGFLSKMAKGSQMATSLAERAAGTGAGKAFVQRAPGPRGQVLEEILMSSKRKANEGKRGATALYEEASRQAEASGLDPRIIRQAFERNDDLPPDVAEALRAQHGFSRGAFDRVQALSEGMGLPTRGPVEENALHTYVPRVQTEHGKRLLAKQRGGGNLTPEDMKSRELVRVMREETTPESGILNPVGVNEPIVTKPEFLEQLPSGQYAYQGEPVKLGQASLQDIEQAIPSLEGAFVAGVPESFLAHANKMANQEAWLTFTKEAEEKGLLHRWEQGTPIPQSMRKLTIKGMEDMVAPKFIANRIENEANKLFDPKQGLGKIESTAKAIMDSPLGQDYQAFTRWFKNNVLPLHLEYQVGNGVSNQSLMFAGGVNPHAHLFRIYESGKVQTGKGPEVFRGLTNQKLGEEFATRDLGESGFIGSEASNPLAEATKTERTGRVLGKIFGEKIGEGAQKVANTVGAANQWGFRQGQKVEANAKYAVAIDWLKKNAPDLGNMAPEQQAKMLDKAALHAHDALIDYTAMTPFERTVMAGAIAPFYQWTRGITAKTARDVIDKPKRLADLGRMYDATMTPMSADDKQVADAWIRDNAPIMGLLGADLPDVPGKGKGMALVGRALPHTTPQQLLTRPIEAGVSMINPLPRSLAEVVYNESSFKKRPIDERAGGFLSGLINPLVGGDYSAAYGKTLGAQLPAAYEYLLSQSPVSRWIAKANQFGTSLGLWQDPRKEPLSGDELMAYGLTGVKLFPFDKARSMRNRSREWNTKARAITRDIASAQKVQDWEEVARGQAALQKLDQDQKRARGMIEGGR